MSFDSERDSVRNRAEQEFNANNSHAELPEGRARHEKMVRFVRAIEADWFETTPLYASINIRHNSDDDEIRDQWFGGTINVYGPKREMDWEATRAIKDSEKVADPFKAVYRIVPGYINASSWEAGNYNSTTASTRREMLHRMQMMAIAIELLNKKNQVCLDWEDIDNPFKLVISQAEELKRYRDAEKVRREQEAKKVSDRKARRERV